MSARKIIFWIGMVACTLIALLAASIYVLKQNDKNTVESLKISNNLMDSYISVSNNLSNSNSSSVGSVDKALQQIFKETTHLNGLEEIRGAISKILAKYKEEYKKDSNSTSTETVKNELDFATRVYVYSVFKQVDENSEIVILNTVVKPILTDLISVINEEQHLLEMLINKKTTFDSDFKNQVSSAKKSYQRKIKELDFLARFNFVDRAIGNKIKAMNVKLDDVENMKRSLYSVLLIGFGSMPTVYQLQEKSNKVNSSLLDITNSISKPVNEDIVNRLSHINLLLKLLIIGFIIVGGVLYSISIIVNNKVFIPLQRKAQEFEKLLGLVETKVQDAKTSVDDVSNFSDVIYSNSENTYSSVLGAENNSQEVATAINEITSTITNISQTVEDVADMISDTNNQADNAKRGFANLTDASSRIHEAVELIKSIADQTNLLALNASIEASRAGDAGRGFSVVAAEVRKLAEKTAGATETIGDLVKEIQTESQSANVTIEAISGKIIEINEVASNIRSAMSEQSTAAEAISENSIEAHNSSTNAKKEVEEIKTLITDSKEKANSTNQSLDNVMQEMEKLRVNSDEFINELSKV
ncbi:MAG: hypothetical protein GY804_07110 [Alphaproteobacteria bacterium]|nr:hypothetical protein [Alphaproteobacteria bacterium]